MIEESLSLENVEDNSKPLNEISHPSGNPRGISNAKNCIMFRVGLPMLGMV